MAIFTSREISLLHHFLEFYQSLQAGVIPANNKDRKHFLRAIMGEVEAETEHEKVFLKYMNSNQQKVNMMIYAWSLNKSNPLNPNFDDEIF